MGCFSWCTSDTKKSIPCSYAGYEGAPDTVYLLNPFGEPYKESNYEGYGEFGGRDVFELVVEWNREYLSSENFSKPERNDYSVLEKYEQLCKAVSEYAAGASDEYMKEKYGKIIGYGNGSDWKRCLGIKLACYDEDHVKLRYPIKIVEHVCDYKDANISPSCPFQGYFYDEPSIAIQCSVDRAFEKLNNAQLKYLDALKSKSFESLENKILSAEQQKDTASSHKVSKDTIRDFE